MSVHSNVALNPTLPEAQLMGWVLAYHSDRYHVHTEKGLYFCVVKGLLKKQGKRVLVGDQVTLDSVDEASKSARISDIAERRNEISRPRIANVDQVLLLGSFRQPAFEQRQFDRMLCHIQLQGLTPHLVFTKADLAVTSSEHEELASIVSLYQGLGYLVTPLSIYWQEAIASFAASVLQGVSVLAGVSGAGKSSLLNAIRPGLSLKVGEVSAKIERGQHTTRHVELLPLNAQQNNSWIADTPGFSLLSLADVTASQIRHSFVELRNYEGQCHFSDCWHEEEAGCLVQEAVKQGLINTLRYLHYKELLEETRQAERLAAQKSSKQELGSTKELDAKGKAKVEIVRLKSKHRQSGRTVEKQHVRQWQGMDVNELMQEADEGSDL